MKRKIILSLITISVLSFASCGNSTTEEPETTVPVETTAEVTPEPTATPEPTVTPEAETTPEATESKAEINENDSQTSEGEAIEDNVEQTTSNSDSLDDIASAKSYTLSEQEKADLRALGATEEQINNVKSGQDFIDLVYKLANGDSTGSSTAGGSSSSTDTDSSESFGDEVHDPSMENHLPAGDGSLPGRM